MRSALGWILLRATTSVVVVVLLIAATRAAAADSLDNLRQTRTLKIAYRDDAPPFSFKDAKGEQSGLMIELCRALAAKMATNLGTGEIKIVYVPVTAASRFDAIAKGDADLLCEATSATLSRRQQVDFSIPTFIDGAGIMVRDKGPRDLKELAGKKIGVLAGTTTEAGLREMLRSSGISATVVPVKSHSEAITELDRGEIAAYFADRSILMFLSSGSGAAKRLRISAQYLSMEPYALALRRGDPDFRLAVDRALSQIYRSGQITAIYAGIFGKSFGMTDTLSTLYQVSGLPE